MKQRYNEVMEHIVVTDEMRVRILAAVQQADLLHDGQPDAVALGGVRLVGLIKLVENMCDAVGRDVLAVVQNTYGKRVVRLGDLDRDRAARLGKLDCVI